MNMVLPLQLSGEKWKPHSGQIKGMKFLIEHAAAALLADPGVGKTSITYGAFKVLKKKGVASKMLVFAPVKPAYLAWLKEALKWTDFHGLKVVVLHGKTQDEKLIPDADVCIVSYGGIDWLTGAKRVRSPVTNKVSVTIDRKRVKNFGFDTLVFDELSRLKHTTSGRFKIVKQMMDLFSRRWGLTGSPVPNGLTDLFGQIYVLDGGRSLGRYITHFRHQFCEKSYDGFGWNIREGAEEQIYERVAPLVLRMAAEDYVDMPQEVPIVHTFELPPKVRKIYDELEEDLITQIEDKILTAATAGVASGKCRQVANGGLYLNPEITTLEGRATPKKREWIDLHTEKVEMVRDLVEELQGQPLLLAYDFQHDLARLKKEFGEDVPVIGGGTKPKDFMLYEKLWNQDLIPLMLAHPQSVGHGLNLQDGTAHHVGWHSLTWDYELYDQFIRRLRRQGSKQKRIFVHHWLAKDTVDETMYYGALASKKKGQQAFFDALKKLRRRRK